MIVSLIIIGSIIIYLFCYRFYGLYLQKKIVQPSENPTPAVRLRDDVDFVPANKYVLFGHHFASIAGAAPIVGPVIALAWGWLPALLWVWLGNIFIGAVHDYLSLMSSVRYDGHSIQWIASKVIKKRTGYLFAWFILFVLILVVAAFGAVLGKIFVAKPQVPPSYFLQIVAALILGLLLYRLRISFLLATLIGIIMLIGAIVLGMYFPINASYKTWMFIFFFYIILAASLPVHVLLQPRDYLNAWLLVAGLILGSFAILFSFKKITLFAFTSFNAPLIAHKPTPFWPVVPLIIACGSLSGFHALVASGTTSKQLSKEIEGLFIGYGSMLTEGFLSTLVIAVVSAYGLNVLAPDLATTLKTDALTFAQHYSKAINSAGGPVGLFSKAYGLAVHTILGLPKEFVTILAAMWVASFAMTTLDTTNRLARYTLTEICEPLKDILPSVFKFITNRWIASLIPAIIGIGLALTGAWSIIWPAFGGANQMLASIALVTVSAWVIRVQKRPGLICLIPALFLWLTVTLAMFWYLFVAVPAFMIKNTLQAYVIGIIVVIMLSLNFLLIYDFFKK
ncbi:MAG: carbon starvation protein A [Candidatus Desulfofervidus auxilii]|nr:carbon starvation protein A [Candidatus Desulfofervidus auxilii]